MVSVTFSVYTTPDGKLAVDAYVQTSFIVWPIHNVPVYSHDSIADLMRIPGKSFVASYTNEVQQMKRLALEYVKYLKRILTSATTVGIDGQPTVASGVKMALTDDGFPIIPLPWDGTLHRKEELEELMSEYIAAHYGETHLSCCVQLTDNLLQLLPPGASAIQSHGER